MADEAKAPSLAVRGEVLERLSTSGPGVRGLVVEELVQAEITKRKEAVLKVLARIDEKHKEQKKLENQGTLFFDAKGEQAGLPTFTKQQADEMKKLREEINRMQVALENAFTNSDFKKLFECGG